MGSSLTKQIQEDSILTSHIKSFGEVPKPSECEVILLTGVTGNLGPHLLQNLLKRPNLKIYCLVRKTAVGLAQTILSNIKLDDDITKRVIWVTGDLCSEKLGIESSKYENLCLEVDAVIHSAVKSNHLELYKKNIEKPNDLRTVNVLGTLKILEFVTTGKVKRIFYASSILGCNRISETETTLSEELIDDDNNGDGLIMGYGVTKFIGDKLMSQAIRRGIPAFVCRFPLIIFDSKTGHMEFKDNHFYFLLQSYMEVGMKPDYASAFPAIPVDVCAKISIDMFLRDDVPVGIYNLLNPHKLIMKSAMDGMAKVCNIPQIQDCSFQDFSNALVSLGKKSSLFPFRIIYFKNDAEKILEKFNLVSKLLLTKEGGALLHNVSSKLRKCVPNIDDMIDTPAELTIRVMQLGKAAGYPPKITETYSKL